MLRTLIVYVKPHVQEDPLSMILGIGYLGAQMEREKLPIALHDERIGTERSGGTKVFALAGKVNHTGLVEVPMGMELRELVYGIGGGVKDGKALKEAGLVFVRGGRVVFESREKGDQHGLEHGVAVVFLPPGAVRGRELEEKTAGNASLLSARVKQ